MGRVELNLCMEKTTHVGSFGCVGNGFSQNFRILSQRNIHGNAKEHKQNLNSFVLVIYQTKQGIVICICSAGLFILS